MNNTDPTKNIMAYNIKCWSDYTRHRTKTSKTKNTTQKRKRKKTANTTQNTKNICKMDPTKKKTKKKKPRVNPSVLKGLAVL